MEEKGFMWDSVGGDRVYGSQDMADAFDGIVTDGVIDADNDFLITIQDSANGVIRIGSGTAWINGRMLKLDGFEDVTLPYHSNIFSNKDSIVVLKCRTDAEHRDFAFVCKLYNISTSTYPVVEDGEILIARFKYQRGVASITSDSFSRESLKKANSRNNKIDVQTDTDISGMIKGAGGKIAKAVKGIDYMSPYGGTIYGPLIPESGMEGGQIVPYPYLGTETSPFRWIYADEVFVGGVNIADMLRGTIHPYAGSTEPVGALLCDGSAVSRTTYAALFAIIGTTYGAGNGSTTFNLPNLKGRVPVGRDAAQAEFDMLGETGGSKTVTLTKPNMLYKGYGNIGGAGTTLGVHDHDGTATAVNILNPYIALNYIIYY